MERKTSRAAGFPTPPKSLPLKLIFNSVAPSREMEEVVQSAFDRDFQILLIYTSSLFYVLHM